jgi:hypothetical protein
VTVKFNNTSAWQRIYDARKNLGGRLFVQEILTPYRENFHSRPGN